MKRLTLHDQNGNEEISVGVRMDTDPNFQEYLTDENERPVFQYNVSGSTIKGLANAPFGKRLASTLRTQSPATFVVQDDVALYDYLSGPSPFHHVPTYLCIDQDKAVIYVPDDLSDTTDSIPSIIVPNEFANTGIRSMPTAEFYERFWVDFSERLSQIDSDMALQYSYKGEGSYHMIDISDVNLPLRYVLEEVLEKIKDTHKLVSLNALTGLADEAIGYHLSTKGIAPGVVDSLRTFMVSFPTVVREELPDLKISSIDTGEGISISLSCADKDKARQLFADYNRFLLRRLALDFKVETPSSAQLPAPQATIGLNKKNTMEMLTTFVASSLAMGGYVNPQDALVFNTVVQGVYKMLDIKDAPKKRAALEIHLD